MSRVLFVDDFINSGTNAVQAINKAIAHALETDNSVVSFGPGVYHLQDFVTIHTHSIAHDDGCGDLDQKDCHIYLKGAKGLTLRGSVHPDGTPATILAGFNHQQPQTLLPSILWAEDCTGLTVENIGFARHPETSGAGVVTSVEDGKVTVKTFPGIYCPHGMGAYCMNRFDLKQNRLVGASITYGFGYDTRWQKIGEDTLCLQDEEIAGMLSPGEGLSWHQSGKTDFQTFFGGCNHLTLNNLRVYNTNSFAILTENCNNITARQVVIKPGGNQLFCGPRDGWKLYRCSGRILLDNCHIQGVRMDGQNVHANYLVLEELLSDTCGIFTCKYAPVPLTENTNVTFCTQNSETATIAQWEIVGRISCCQESAHGVGAAPVVTGTHNMATRYKITFRDGDIAHLHPGTLAVASCWLPESYVCLDSSFVNIAGAGQLLRCSNVTIRGCSYRNLMNAGILLGAERDTHAECSHCQSVVIENCVFENCGFKPRYGVYGMGGIAVKSQGFEGPFNKDIQILGNTFSNCSVGIELRDCADVSLDDNTFNCVATPVLADPDVQYCLEP